MFPEFDLYGPYTDPAPASHNGNTGSAFDDLDDLDDLDNLDYVFSDLSRS